MIKSDGSINYYYSTPSGVEMVLDVAFNWDSTALGVPDPRDPFSEAFDPHGDIEVVDAELDIWEMNADSFEPHDIRVAARMFRIWKNEIIDNLNSPDERILIFEEIAA